MSTVHSEVQIFIAGRDLLDADTFSKSDPYAILKDVSDRRQRVVGSTEVIKNNLNPQFKTVINAIYFFEYKQAMRIEFWDKDTGKPDDFLGYAEFTMATLVSAKDSRLELPLIIKNDGTGKEKTKGIAIVTGLLVGKQKGFVKLTLRGQELPNIAMCSTVSPTVCISRQVGATHSKPVYVSERAKATCNPQWAPTPDISLVDLCGAETASQCVRLECFHGSKSLGGTIVFADQLIQRSSNQFPLQKIGAGNQQNSTGKRCGFLHVDRCEFTKSYDFVEFLQHGMEINIAFSIDFTGSNGNPGDRRSLHYHDPNVPNNYIRAMLAVSNVVQEYDSDRMFPAFGFGAVAPFTQGVSHFFPLNGNPQSAYLNGMQAVVDTYASLLPTLLFSGPTNFAPTVVTMTEGARQARGVYTILLILTDGAITDMADTIDAIVAADDAPLSIVIIGIGNADFASMEQLDGDGSRLKDRRGRVARRDLVQFVPFREFEGKIPELLAAAVLEEVPLQVETWARINGVKPQDLTHSAS